MFLRSHKLYHLGREKEWQRTEDPWCGWTKRGSNDERWTEGVEIYNQIRVRVKNLRRDKIDVRKGFIRVGKSTESYDTGAVIDGLNIKLEPKKIKV